MYINWIILLSFLLIVLGCSIPFIVKYIKKKKNSMSFKVSMDLEGLPIIRLYCSDHQLNFLIDTGSDRNCIDLSTLKYLHYTETGKYTTVVGFSTPVQSPIVNLLLDDGNASAKESFSVLDLSTLNEGKSMKVHGILGSDFCFRAGIIIDYNKCEVYS